MYCVCVSSLACPAARTASVRLPPKRGDQSTLRTPSYSSSPLWQGKLASGSTTRSAMRDQRQALYASSTPEPK